jgi:hypothetical protein
MTTMTATTIADFPAYRIYKAYDGRKFKHGDKIAIPFETRHHGVLYSFFTLGTVEGYAIQNGECPHAALARHEKFAAELRDGRKRYWANADSVCLHNGPVTKIEVPGFNFGDVIILQGHSFTLTKAPNNNVSLVPVA